MYEKKYFFSAELTYVIKPNSEKMLNDQKINICNQILKLDFPYHMLFLKKHIITFFLKSTVEAACNLGFCRRYLSGFSPAGKLNAPNSITWDWLVRTFNAGCISK